MSARILGYNDEIRFLIYLAILVMAADAFTLTFYGVLRGYQLLKFEAYGLLIGQTTIAAIGAVILIFNPTLPLLIVALFSGSAVNMFWSGSVVVKKLGCRSLVPVFNAIEMKKMISIAIPFFLAGVFVKIYSYTDTIILSKYINETAVGIYAIAYKLTYSFQFLPMAFVAALYPGLSALIATDKEKLKETFFDAMWYMLIVSVPIVFGVWSIAPELINLFVGPEFVDSIYPLRVLIFVLIPIFLDFPVGSLLNAAGMQSIKTTLMGITMVINVVANAILIPKYGIIGASISGVISFVFLLFGGLVFVSRVVDFSFLRFASISVKIIISGAVMAAIVVILKNYVNVAIVIPAASVIYLAMLLATRSISRGHLIHAVSFLRIKNSSYETNSSSNS